MVFTGSRDSVLKRNLQNTFEEGDVAYLVPDGVAFHSQGISLARTIEDSKYAGLILQTLSQGGRFPFLTITSKQFLK